MKIGEFFENRVGSLLLPSKKSVNCYFKGLLACCALFQFCSQLNAQEVAEPEKPFTVYRPKIAQFDFENIYEYRTVSNSEQFGDASTEVETDKLFKIKLGVPVVLREDRKFGFQIKYSQQRFNLDLNNPLYSFELYNRLDTEVFKAVALRFLYERSIADNKSINIAGGSEIRGDRLEWSQNTTKHFLSFGYDVELNERTNIGFGLVASNSLGVFQVIPIFNYSKKLTPKWALDLALPKSASIRYMVNDKLYLIARSQVRGWRYNINQPIDVDLDQATVRKADLFTSLIAEREIHDWLWVGAEFGFIKNLRYYLAEPGDRRRDALIDLRSNDAAFFKASIFIVPPRKFYK